MGIPDCNEPPMSRVLTRECERSGQKERWPHSTRAEWWFSGKNRALLRQKGMGSTWRRG